MLRHANHHKPMMLIAAVICLLVTAVVAQAQTPDARLVVKPALDPKYDRATFDLVLRRLTERWQYFANITIRLQSTDLAPTGGYNPAVHKIQFVYDSCDLQLVPFDSASMNAYTLDYNIVNGDLVVNILGPDSVLNAYSIPSTTDSLRLGRFIITSTDGSYVPEQLAIVQPADYYQAAAFKIDHDSVTGNGSGRNTWFNRHDNPPMVVEYEERLPPPDTCGAIFNFYGSYIGDMQVQLGFTVSDEHCYEGYIIERALVNRQQPEVLDFQGRSQLTYLNEPRLRSCYCLEPQVHDSLYDQVEYRRETYAYRLIGKRLPYYGDTLQIIDTLFLYIPNAIISNARILENPFQDQTTVRFNVDDRLRLTAKVFDLGGRLIGYLENDQGVPIENVEYAIGIGYELRFKAPSIASQGLYNILLVAVPVNDSSFDEESSRVIIKAQLLR